MSAIPPHTPAQPPGGYPPGAYPPQIPNHMAWAIVSTIMATLCCCPLGLLGIIGIVQANKVNTLLMQGDEVGARHASSQARTWSIVATALAVLGLLINIIFLATGGMQQYMQYMQAVG